ncbi:protein AAR2 homolog [Schistocerca cancellata]|uniref:protein AAR2 homolog n=1 Tax=Schistocerca cancellata TaxID=274614 RepID=UPI002118F042|nr:protein AAR2 homolog [Schistocerca cancellata]
MADQPLDIDQDLAKRLLVEGAIIIIRDLPPGTEFGIDLKSWNTGNKFLGVKMIPPGVHYVHYSATDQLGDTAPRSGFMYDFKTSEVVVRRWDKDAEDLDIKDVGDEEKARVRSNLLNLDRFLGPYPFDIWKKWQSMTNKISARLAERLMPECGQVRSAPEMAPTPSDGDGAEEGRRGRRSGATAEEREERLLPALCPLPGTAPRLTPLPLQGWPRGATPAEVTRHSLDSSFKLDTLLQQMDSPDELLGELQFCFVLFLVGHSLDAFEHWKRLVRLLCSCVDALGSKPQFFVDFISVLETQVTEIPEEFLADIVANKNFVYVSLRELFRNLQDTCCEADSRLKARGERLARALTGRLGWDFSELELEEDDEAPVVVEL